MPSQVPQSFQRSVFAVRLVVALVQAAALYLLTSAAEPPPAWPATDSAAFLPLLLAASFAPLTVLASAGQIAARPLALWALLTALLTAGLGYHAAARGTAVGIGPSSFIVPQFQFCVALTGFMFIAHVLVTDSVIEARLVPPYQRHFDSAWKLGLQAILAGAFTGVFWGVLVLGAGLFKLLDFDVFVRLIQYRWFVFPATALALALSVHATDVQPALIRGVRTVVLTLVSWLLPLLAAILAGFLLTLPFVSLAPLWRTHFAGALLLTVAGCLVFLINSQHQDGAAEHARSRIKRLAAKLGAIELVPVTALAAWALALRVQQYGWTSERIFAAAITLLAACYALGYAASLLAGQRVLEITNLAAAYVTLALILALFSPVADPARLMVASQMARLESGAVAADKFDFAALRFDGARWGAAALAQLSAGTNSDLANRARTMLAVKSRYEATDPSRQPVSAAQLADRVTIYPAGQTLPDGFYAALAAINDPRWWAPCLHGGVRKCDVRVLQLPGSAAAAVLFAGAAPTLFEQDADGRWQRTGELSGQLNCTASHDALQTAPQTLAPHPWPDVLLGNQRFSIVQSAALCPPVKAKP